MHNFRKIIKQGINGWHSFQSPFMQTYPPGHFYSPVPRFQEALSAQETTYSQRHNRECPGVDLCEQDQLELLEKFNSLYQEFKLPRKPQKPFRYYYDNGFFPGGDAVILYSMMRQFKPQRIIEVGSGFSSAAMLDIDDGFLEGKVNFCFIEPYPDRFYSLLKNPDRNNKKIVVSELQNVEFELFISLGINDILFIDSSHVLRIGSDVSYILFKLLPILRPGVIIHFHDIPWPFEYPKEYFMAGRAWNEAYAIRSFLQYNNCFKILHFNSYMRTFFAQKIEKTMPIFADTPSSSLWLQKIGC